MAIGVEASSSGTDATLVCGHRVCGRAAQACRSSAQQTFSSRAASWPASLPVVTPLPISYPRARTPRESPVAPGSGRVGIGLYFHRTAPDLAEAQGCIPLAGRRIVRILAGCRYRELDRGHIERYVEQRHNGRGRRGDATGRADAVSLDPSFCSASWRGRCATGSHGIFPRLKSPVRP